MLFQLQALYIVSKQMGRWWWMETGYFYWGINGFPQSSYKWCDRKWASSFRAILKSPPM